MKVDEIEAAITELPAREVSELLVWLAEYHQTLWEVQIEDDLNSGRLDAVLAEVDREYQAGQAQPL